METRSISTQIWREPDFIALDDKSKLIVLFLLGNDKIPVLPAYKISTQEITLYCSTTTQRVDELLPTLSKFGIYYKYGYIIIEDFYTRAKYTGGKTESARERLWNSFPVEIKNIVDIDGTIDQSLLNDCPTIEEAVAPINHISYTINHKPINQTYRKLESLTPEVLESISTEYKMPVKYVEDKLEDLKRYCGSHGKTYKDYKDTLMGWCRKDWDKSKAKYREPIKIEIVETSLLTDAEREQGLKNLELAKNIFKKPKGGELSG